MKRKIGRTGVSVFPIGLGAMPLSIDHRPDEGAAIEVIRAAVEHHVDFIDTADVYCLNDEDIGHNERLIAKALKAIQPPQAVHIATKGGLRRPGGDWVTDASPKRLREACERSLKNLGVERIFLYQMHAVDHQIPLEDSVGELARLQKEGKVAHIGLSNINADHLRRAQKIVRIESVQNRCNVFEQRDFQEGLADLCCEMSVTYIPHSPVGGWGGHRRMMGQKIFNELAAKYNRSPYVIALAWLLQKGDHILPIPGASRPESIIDSTQAASVRLEPDDFKALTEKAQRLA